MRPLLALATLCFLVPAACARGHDAPPAKTPARMTAPDLKGAVVVGQKTIDQIPEIPGAETTLRAFVKNGRQYLLLTLQNGSVYAFAVRERGKAEHIFADRDNDGAFEETGPTFFIDVGRYGFVHGESPVAQDGPTGY